MYGIYATESATDNHDDDDDDEEYIGDEYSDNIEGYWCDYVAEKHKGYIT
jgi:hypothetical protein